MLWLKLLLTRNNPHSATEYQRKCADIDKAGRTIASRLSAPQQGLFILISFVAQGRICQGQHIIGYSGSFGELGLLG